MYIFLRTYANMHVHKNYICTVILIKIMIQKEGMDLLHNLLIQSLQLFEMSIDLFLLGVCRYEFFDGDSSLKDYWDYENILKINDSSNFSSILSLREKLRTNMHYIFPCTFSCMLLTRRFLQNQLYCIYFSPVLW